MKTEGAWWCQVEVQRRDSRVRQQGETVVRTLWRSKNRKDIPSAFRHEFHIKVDIKI